MKKKRLLGIIALMLLSAVLWWWFSGNKDLVDMIPAKSKAVVRLSVAAYEHCDSTSLLTDITGLPQAGTGGSNAYIFITPNEYFGLALSLQDISAFEAALPKSVTRSEEEEGHWYWTETGWLAVRKGKTLLALGPATPQERDRLRHTLLVMLEAPADEGFGHSDRAKALQTEAPMAFVASPSVLPAPYGTLLRLGLPDTQSPITGEANLSEGTLDLKGGILGQKHKEVAQTAVRASHLFQATLLAEGPELLKRLRSDGTLRVLLTALSDSTSAEDDIKRMHGTVSLLVTKLDTAGNPTFRLSGTDKAGNPVVLQSRQAPEEAAPLPLSPNTSAHALIDFHVLLAAPLPEGIRGVLQTLFGSYRQAELTTTRQGDFRLSFIP